MRSSVITKLTVAIITMFLVVFVSYTVLVSIRDWQSNKASEEQALVTTSELSALEIQAVFNETFDRLRTDADVLAAAYTAGELNAEMILQTKRQLMAQNEQWLSNSSIFEPNVVAAKTDDGQAFIDASNRFVPYFIRHDDGSLYETSIENYEQEVWYVEPVQYGKTMMMDPYDYEVGTETLSMVSLIVPVTAASDVIGYVSADFAINFLSELVAEHAPTEGVQRVVTNSGFITATSDNRAMIGQTIEAFSASEEAISDALNAQQASLLYGDDDVLQTEVASVVSPISLRNVEGNWGVISSVPVAVMNAPLMNSLAWSLIGAAVMAFILAATIFYIVRRQLKPLVPLQAALEKAAEGDLTANVSEVRLANDEIGNVAKAYNYMIDQTRTAVSGVLKAASDIDVQTTNSAASMQAKALRSLHKKSAS